MKVKIYNKEYDIDPGTLTELEVAQISSLVDQKMKEIADGLGIVDTQKIAVLAALNIAFEMTEKSGKANPLPAESERKIRQMIHHIDKTLA